MYYNLPTTTKNISDIQYFSVSVCVYGIRLVDPDPVGPEMFWSGRIRNNCNGFCSVSDLLNKKICILFTNFSSNGLIRSRVHTILNIFS
jgi:hypothetical protein